MAHKLPKPLKVPKLPEIPWDPWGGLKRKPMRSTERPRRLRLKKPNLKTKTWQIITGDYVQLLVGRDKGKQGKVTKVVRGRNLVFVEGVNADIEYQPGTDKENGYGYLKSKPIDIKDVAIVDPTDNQPCTTVYRYTEAGDKVRVSTRTGRIISKPLWSRKDWKTRDSVQDGSYDTAADDVAEVTYLPSLLYFHEEILLSLNVKPTIPKTELEKRDLIFQFVEKEAKGDSTLPDEQQLEVYKPGLYIRTLVYFMGLISKVRGFFKRKK